MCTVANAHNSAPDNFIGLRWQPNWRFIFNSCRAMEHTNHISNLLTYIEHTERIIVMKSTFIDLISNLNLDLDN